MAVAVTGAIVAAPARGRPSSRASRPWRRRGTSPSMKPQSPMRLVTKAFLPAEALASLREPERDQEVGAGADALPAEEGDEHVAAQHQHQHREDEQVQVHEELRELRVAVHVADRVQVDQRADAGDEQRHRDRQRVDQEPDAHVEAADVDPVEEVVDVARGRARPRRAAPTNTTTVATKAPPHASGGQPAGGGLAEPAAEHEQHEEAGQRERGDEPDEVEGVHASALQHVDVVGGGRRAACGAGPR